MLTINNGDPLFTRNLSLNKSTYRYLQITFGFCPFTPVESKTWPCKAKRDFFIQNPTIRGDIVFLLFGMAVGEPPRQDPGGTKGCALQSRGALRAPAGGGFIERIHAAWSRSWQLLASTLSSCWLVK